MSQYLAATACAASCWWSQQITNNFLHSWRKSGLEEVPFSQGSCPHLQRVKLALADPDFPGHLLEAQACSPDPVHHPEPRKCQETAFKTCNKERGRRLQLMHPWGKMCSGGTCSKYFKVLQSWFFVDLFLDGEHFLALISHHTLSKRKTSSRRFPALFTGLTPGADSTETGGTNLKLDFAFSSTQNLCP